MAGAWIGAGGRRFSAGLRHTLGWRGKKGKCNRKEKKKSESQWKWKRGWPFSPLATPEMLNLICLGCGFPSSPAAHGANVVTGRKPTVKTHLLTQHNGSLQTSESELLNLLTKASFYCCWHHRAEVASTAERDSSRPCTPRHSCQGNAPSQILHGLRMQGADPLPGAGGQQPLLGTCKQKAGGAPLHGHLMTACWCHL